MKSRMIEKKNEIYIQKGRESYSLNYIEEDACREPEIIINSMGFYDVIEGLLEIPKDVYKKGITKIRISEYCSEIPKKEITIFKGLIDILEKFSMGDKDLENKIKEIKKTLINKNNKRKFLTKEISRNEEKSFNSLYKLTK